MMIGRSDERVNPMHAMAGRGRDFVVVSFAEPIWASGHRAASKAGHMTAFAPLAKSSSRPLAPEVPFSNRASFVNCLLLAALVAMPGSRFSPRSAFAAATSGPKHRRCNVHNGLTWHARGPTTSLAARLHPRPGGQPAPASASCAGGSRQGLVRPPLPAPTSGTARRTARCCAGSPTACGPAPRAPCRCPTASRSPAPNPSTARPA